MIKITQKPLTDHIEDVTEAVREAIEKAGFCYNLKKKTVAVAVGSRGIANLPDIVKATVLCLKAAGAKPFIVPAMGSHGGATAEGQLAVLEALGITSASIGVDIKSSMDTVEIDKSWPMLVDKNAWEADYILPINRIKPHTTFSGKYESGIHKMLTIGLGKEKGARKWHRTIRTISDAMGGFGETIELGVKALLQEGKILGAVAVVENAFHQTSIVRALKADQLNQELHLLDEARRYMLYLPFKKVDLLIVDEIGKEISGTGMDTNVIGRKSGFSEVEMIYVRGLTKATQGNATGIGLADFCHSDVLKQIDRKKTNANCLASGFPEKAKIPIAFDTDKEAIDAVSEIFENPKIVWIRNTLDLVDCYASDSYLYDAKTFWYDIGDPFELSYKDGQLQR